MKLFIHTILLYPKNQARKVRDVAFQPGVVNIVTGTSARGKSAIGHIIDYCLGSGKCAIPVGIIRETVAWYALVIELDDLLLFVARREPEAQQSTDHFCFFDIEASGIPRVPERNSSRPAFKARMDDLCGLPKLDIALGTSEAGFGRASFRDMAAFNFLPQHIVANPQTLFAKTDTTEHREKLRRIFPLVLGVIDAAYLLAQHEERDLRVRLQRVMDELGRRRAAADTWRAELFGLHSRAKEVGLIDATVPSPNSIDTAVATFRRILRSTSTRDLPGPQTGSTEEALTELGRLTRQESAVATSLAQARRHLRRISDLSLHLRAYSDQLVEENSRVVGAGWFRQNLKKDECPFCGTVNERASEQIGALVAATEELEGLVKSAQQAPGDFAREEVDLRVAIRAHEEELQSLRQERQELEDASREAARARQQMSEVYRLLGRVEQALSNLGQTSDDGELVRRADEFKKRIDELNQILDSDGVEKRMAGAISFLSRLVAVPAKAMELERSDDTIELIPTELTLKFLNPSGRDDYLWEIGSGENWMGYHIAIMLALHEYFLRDPRNPVPSFLVIDQPTQVYFPARNDTYDRAKRETAPDAARTGDFARARRIFEALASAVKRMKGRCQIIVTEHADELTWGGIEGVQLVENWRGDDYLIPVQWRDDMPKRESGT